MNRTITIKGIGKMSLKPDYTVVSLSLKTVDMVYDQAMDKAAEYLENLRNALVGIGFSEGDLKTTDFQVGTEYRNEQDKNRNYRQIFAGYYVRHQLKVEFGFDTRRLSKTLGAIAACVAEPGVNIQFTMKAPEAVNAALLESACINAKAKAEVLAKASGVTLGELISINYNWGELHLYSPTRCKKNEGVLTTDCAAAFNMDIEPENIDVSESAVFVWEIQ